VYVKRLTGVILTMVVLGAMPAAAAKPGEKTHPHEKTASSVSYYDRP
jgi:hypothetical protein